MRFLISAFADEISRDLDEQIAGLKELGINYMEPRFIGQKGIADITAEEAHEIRSKLDRGGIGISAIGSPIGKIGINDDMDKHIEVFRRVASTAKILGTKRIRIFSFYMPKDEDPAKYKGEVMRRLGLLLDEAKKEQVLLCHENEHGIYGDSPESCLDILQSFGGEIKAVHDTCNFIMDGYEPYPHGFEAVKPYLEYIHIKDGTAEKLICPAGEGIGRIKDILREASGIDRDWYLTLEPHLRVFAGLDALSSNAEELNRKHTYKTAKEAFTAAANGLFQIIGDLGLARY